MDTKRLILSGGELRDCPGFWKITGRIEGDSDSWSILRKPDGTYWEVAGEDYFPRTGGTLRIDVGDQILDAKKIVQCEEYYEQLQQKLAESKEPLTMGRYARRTAKSDESKHPTYGSIWEAEVEIEDKETRRVVKVIKVDDRDGREAVKQASSEASKWIAEQDRLEGELAILDKKANHVITAVGAATTTKDRELAKGLFDSLQREIVEQRARIKAHFD
jgi:hypothetical protein